MSVPPPPAASDQRSPAEETALHPRALRPRAPRGPEAAAGLGIWSRGSRSGSPQSAQPGPETLLQGEKTACGRYTIFTTTLVNRSFSH